MGKISIKNAVRVILLGALAPLTLAVIMLAFICYLYISDPGRMDLEGFARSPHYYGVFVIFGVQSILYCAGAVVLGKRGPIAGIVLSSAAFVIWSILFSAGAPGDSFAGSLFNFVLLGTAFSFGAALIAEYTVLFMTRIGFASAADPELDNLSYWRRRLSGRAKA
ncbi:MAG: hypothetical protein ACLQGV_06145 [Bryobacteraceae bacterium]